MSLSQNGIDQISIENLVIKKTHVSYTCRIKQFHLPLLDEENEMRKLIEIMVH